MIYNSLSQDTEIDLINRLAPFLENRTFIDVGAEKGVFSLVMLELGMSGVMFEPLPKHHAALGEIVGKYVNAKLHVCAVTDRDTKQIFNIATDVDGNEMDYYHSLQKADAPGIFSHSKSFEVECRSLQSMAGQGIIPVGLGVLKTDTEGNDLNVLRGLGSLRPELVICEYFTQGLYEGWEDAAPVALIEHMKELGYDVYIATKRFGDLEFVGVGVTMFQEKQWGNLFFFRSDFHAKVHGVIADFIQASESRLVDRFNKINSDLEDKERVIQQLLSEKQAMLVQGRAGNGWLNRILRSTGSNSR